MAKNVSVDNFADALVDAIQAYTDDVVAAIDLECDAVADRILMEAAMNAPHNSGEYARTLKKTTRKDYSKTRRIIWNKKHYRRVHLLEFGHAKKDGGRVQAFPHLRPAYEKHGKTFPETCKRIIKRGGAL